MRFTRRQILTATGGTVVLGSLAGCTGGGGGGGGGGTQAVAADEHTAQSSFFVFGDITASVAGDAATAELLTPVGQHGHGWEPGPRVRESIADASLFVHGMTGFQPWVDRILPDLEADGSDVRSVDVSAGLDLLEATDDHDHDHGAEDGHDGETHTEQETADHDSEDSHDDHDAEDAHDSEDSHDDHDAEDGHDSDDDHDDHSGATDPHFWMDPLRVVEATDTVRQGLAAIDPDNAETYATNAGQFSDRVRDLHDQTAAVVDDSPRDVLLVAGHNSFRYFGERYDVTVETLSNVSPDDRPTPRDIERAREVIAEHGLRYICADPLESQRAAEQLVAETDAEAVLPLTAIPGLTSEWGEKGWGYVDVFENVNLPTLERALAE